MARGAVAAGSPEAVEAGLGVLRDGGSAADAAIAASLMAGVSEPLLAGLGGAGLAMLRTAAGEVACLDLFAAMPGLSGKTGGPMREILVDFGTTTQPFWCGPASVAPWGVPGGLAALHARAGRLPLARLAEPAARRAEEGQPVSRVAAVIFEMLASILQEDAGAAAAWRPGGRALPAGAVMRRPAYAETLRAFGREGAAPFQSGAVAAAAVARVGAAGKLSMEDLAAWAPAWVAPLSVAYRGAVVHLPPPPSVGGLLLAQALRALEQGGEVPAMGSAEEALRLAAVLGLGDRARRERIPRGIGDPAFVDGFLTALDLPAPRGRIPGHTTHVSVVDADGAVVTITQSLGETAGIEVPGTGMWMNNLLGEADVNPPAARIPAGARLQTMCTPVIVEHAGGVVALGSSGSSRIRSAVLNGIVARVDHRAPLRLAVDAPRVHVDEGQTLLEGAGRPAAVVAAVEAALPEARVFREPTMFFGGMNAVACGPLGVEAAGDRRRGGAEGLA